MSVWLSRSLGCLQNVSPFYCNLEWEKGSFPMRESIFWTHLPRIIICDLDSKSLSCVTKITLEAGRPHPLTLGSLPSGLMSSDFKGNAARPIVLVLIFCGKARVCGLLHSSHALNFHLSPFAQGWEGLQEASPLYILWPLVWGSGLAREWFQDS